MDKIWELRSRGGGGRQGRRNQRERGRESSIRKDGYRDTEMTRRTRDDQMVILYIIHNVSCNPIVTVPNTPLASAPVK